MYQVNSYLLSLKKVAPTRSKMLINITIPKHGNLVPKKSFLEKVSVYLDL
jgi:hypothetical protein